ncbi:metallophosphoesterase family protein [Plastoroseomonas arctica]|uniref:Metallophosphoesterase family protein n=1 Tax=Plastoroseomonas arctica TaxID=1509237 RepID=A0AAF1JV38_9PROT|nr:metallophosphoesterase family protein [Plastoroseomonas arctica]MBR0654370.1 metallophosphoesterase family protein [Plastoroseomonas arctica]
MLIALMSDIHGNLEAFSACLADADQAAPGARLVALGDFVGYGADPNAVTRLAMGRATIAIRGNHDEAATSDLSGMTADAAAAIAWTRTTLAPDVRDWLARLPLEAVEEDRLYVHAEASRPGGWRYVMDADTARHSIEATEARLTFTGHTHVPVLFGLTATEKITRFRPVPDVPVPMPRPRRWLAGVGSVGQPRDGNPAACYAIFDTDTAELTFRRVAYDIATAAAKIRAAGLPERLASRLLHGH